MNKCAICQESSENQICAECRSDPFWAGLSNEVLVEHGNRCEADVERGRRWIAQGFSPFPVTGEEQQT